MIGKPRWRPEHGERTVARLEAFSDIVIGFSLAEATYVLAIPAHAADVLTDPVTIFGFAMTYLVVAMFWWNHHRVFTSYFVPEPIPIVLNFIALAAQGFSIFALQMWLHFGPHVLDAYTSARIYFGSVGSAFALLAVIQGYGILRVGEALEIIQRRRAVRTVVRRLGMTIGILVGVVISGHAGFAQSFAHSDILMFGPEELPIPHSLLLGCGFGALIGTVVAWGVVSVLDRASKPREEQRDGAA